MLLMYEKYYISRLRKLYNGPILWKQGKVLIWLKRPTVVFHYLTFQFTQKFRIFLQTRMKKRLYLFIE